MSRFCVNEDGWRLKPRLRDALARIREACLRRLQICPSVVISLEAAEAAFAAAHMDALSHGFSRQGYTIISA